jgi:hypothetical protein
MTFRASSLWSLSAGLVAFLVGASAGAQQVGPVTGGVLTSAIPPLSPENGLLISESALLHAGVTVEGGYDSNVFYDDTAGNHYGSSILRINPFLDISNTARNGEVPSGLFFDARASLAYREYLTSDPTITQLRTFSPTLSASLEHNTNGTIAFGLSEMFSRAQDAPYTHGMGRDGLIIRDNNVAAAQLRLAPGGGRIQGVVRFGNTIDYFETPALKPASSMTNELMLDASWRWLPKTALYVQVRQGYVTYLNSEDASGLVAATPTEPAPRKSASFPLRAFLGIRGLITEKTSVSLALGYQNAFYSNGQSTFGFFGSTLALGELVVMPILTSKITFGARHEFQNSVIGNFFYDDGAYLALSYQTVARLIAQTWASYDHKQYYGLPGINPRIDDLIQAGAMLDYYLKTWAFAGVSYTLALNRSDYMSTQGVADLSGTNYTKHQVFARVGITY